MNIMKIPIDKYLIHAGLIILLATEFFVAIKMIDNFIRPDLISIFGLNQMFVINQDGALSRACYNEDGSRSDEKIYPDGSKQIKIFSLSNQLMRVAFYNPQATREIHYNLMENATSTTEQTFIDNSTLYTVTDLDGSVISFYTAQDCWLINRFKENGVLVSWKYFDFVTTECRSYQLISNGSSITETIFADRSAFTETSNPDGSSATEKTFVDGSSLIKVLGVDGSVTITHTSADRQVTHTAQENAAGVLIFSEIYNMATRERYHYKLNPDGSSATEKTFVDGSSLIKVLGVDGSVTTAHTSANWQVQHTEQKNAAGVLIFSESHNMATHERYHYKLNPDGSSVKNQTFADGSSLREALDIDGAVTITHFSADYSAWATTKKDSGGEVIFSESYNGWS